MLVAAAVVPHPPLLVPGASGATDMLADVRAVAGAAVSTLLVPGPDIVALVGAGAVTCRHPADAVGGLRPWGPDVGVGGQGRPVLPLSLVVARWLLDAAAGALGRTVPPVLLQEVAPDAAAVECRRLGGELAEAAARVALLVAGDGTARLTERSPGWLDARAADWDERCTAALGGGDAAALARLDPALGADLLTAGLPAWRVLAAAAASGTWDAEVLAREAPFGVSYLVARWTRCGRAG